MKMWTMLLLVMLGISVVSSSPTASGEESESSSPLEFFDDFIGSWTGQENATFGKGVGERTYERVLQGRYLMYRNRSVYPPQEALPNGDEHEDWTFLSYDENRKRPILRQFNSEGFVNRFFLEELGLAPDGRGLERAVFVAEASENASPDLRARLTLEIESESVFHERFELARPGKEFSTLIRNRWTRKEGQERR